MNIKAMFKTNAQRQLEVRENELGELFELTKNVPGETLTERIKNLLPPEPFVKPGMPPLKMVEV